MGEFYTEPRQETSYYSVRPQLFQTEVKPPSPPSSMCALSACSRHSSTNRWLSSCRHTLGPSCVFLPFVPSLASPCISLSFLLPSLLVSAFQPSQAKCVTKSAERNALFPKFTSVGIPFFSVSFSPDP